MSELKAYLNISVSEWKCAYTYLLIYPDGTSKLGGEIFYEKSSNQLDLISTCTLFRLFLRSQSKFTDLDTLEINTMSPYLIKLYKLGAIYRYEKTGYINKINDNDLLWESVLNSYKIPNLKINKITEVPDELINFTNKLLS